eukprot:4365164-Prymnesium_polylepis.1
MGAGGEARAHRRPAPNLASSGERRRPASRCARWTIAGRARGRTSRAAPPRPCARHVWEAR